MFETKNSNRLLKFLFETAIGDPLNHQEVLSPPINAADATKDRLLEAAVQVFAEKGFKAATVREICNLAGVNVAAVNYHFGDKQSLYNAVVEFMFTCAEHHDEFQALPHRGELSPEEKIRRLIFYFVRQVYKGKCDERSGADMGTIFRMEMVRPSKRFRELMEEYIYHNAGALRAVVREYLGEKAPDKLVFETASAIAGQVMYYALARPIAEFLNPDHCPDEAFMDSITDTITEFSLGGLAALKKRLDEDDDA
jgi:AcrR family transcriptional regulator